MSPIHATIADRRAVRYDWEDICPGYWCRLPLQIDGFQYLARISASLYRQALSERIGVKSTILALESNGDFRYPLGPSTGDTAPGARTVAEGVLALSPDSRAWIWITNSNDAPADVRPQIGNLRLARSFIPCCWPRAPSCVGWTIARRLGRGRRKTLPDGGSRGCRKRPRGGCTGRRTT